MSLIAVVMGQPSHVEHTLWQASLMTLQTVIVDGLEFPEGPIAMPDGSVVLVEMRGERITRVHADGTTKTVAEFRVVRTVPPSDQTVRSTCATTGGRSRGSRSTG